MFGFCYKDTLFEAKFMAFIKESYEKLRMNEEDKDARMFASD
jgi:hypothetical protein